MTSPDSVFTTLTNDSKLSSIAGCAAITSDAAATEVTLSESVIDKTATFDSDDDTPVDDDESFTSSVLAQREAERARITDKKRALLEQHRASTQAVEAQLQALDAELSSVSPKSSVSEKRGPKSGRSSTHI